MRALAVDDSKFQQPTLVGYLCGLGVENLVANNGEEVPGITLEGPMLDLIIMDKDMPEMDGIQAFFFSLSTTIVGNSADTEKEVEQEFQDAEVDEFIRKPVHMEKLISLLTKIGKKYDNEQEK